MRDKVVTNDTKVLGWTALLRDGRNLYGALRWTEQDAIDAVLRYKEQCDAR
jgi:hypothetical protein